MNRLNTYMLDSGGGGSNARSSSELVYDPKTGTWVPATASGQTASSIIDKTPSNSNSSTQVDSKTEAEKEYIETEFNTLTGELSLVSTEKTIRIKVNDTIKIEGLGKYLSGLYFVTSIKRTLSKDSGYTHTLSLLKNGFGSLKQARSSQVSNEEPRKTEVPKSTSELKVGDSVKIVGDDAVYSNASDGVKVPAWVKKKTLTISQISSDKTRVLLKEIFSWTYVKYIQKV